MVPSQSWRNSHVIAAAGCIDDEDIRALHSGTLAPCEPLYFPGGFQLEVDWSGAGGGSGVGDIDAVCDLILSWRGEGLQLGQRGRESEEQTEKNACDGHFGVVVVCSFPIRKTESDQRRLGSNSDWFYLISAARPNASSHCLIMGPLSLLCLDQAIRQVNQSLFLIITCAAPLYFGNNIQRLFYVLS